MNTRGLMQLVILNLGFELGVINQALFSMLVVMALVTTFLTTPLLEWINPVRERRAESTVARV
jgi:Kef-type K+ transport system membrane component KefB